MNPLHVPVFLAGEHARRRLAADGPLRVLAVFERSFYVETVAGALVCIGERSIGAGPLVVLCAPAPGGRWRTAGIERGATGRVRAGAIALGGIELDWGRAPAWTPPPPLASIDASRLRGGLQVLAASARAQAPGAGLGGLLPGVAGPAPAAVAPGLDTAALPALRALRAWVAGPAAVPVPNALNALVGLGPGLTPSGDDVLAGALVVLHALAGAPYARALARSILPLAATRTGPVSRAYLDCAAAGAGPASLHRLIRVLAQGTRGAVREATSACVAVGHTSGWDGVVGVAAVVAGLVDRSARPGGAEATGPGTG